MPPEDSLLFMSLRDNIIKFLVDIQQTVAAFTTDDPLYAIQNSIQFYQTWFKLFALVMQRRTAFHKSPSQSFTSNLELDMPMFTKSMSRLVRHRHLKFAADIPTAWNERLLDFYYWNSHNRRFSALKSMEWIKYILRFEQDVYIAHRLLPPHPSAVVKLAYMKQILELTSHDYDKIRQLATKTLPDLINRIPEFREELLLPLLECISSPISSYYKMQGALDVLCNISVIGVILSNWKYNQMYFQCVNACQGIMNKLDTTPDKREKLLTTVSLAFSLYAEYWKQYPISLQHKVEAAAMISSNISSFELAGPQQGARYKCFTAFQILQFTLHAHVRAPIVNCFKWTVTLLSSARVDAVQSLGLSVLSRLAFAIAQHEEEEEKMHLVAAISASGILSNLHQVLMGIIYSNPQLTEDASIVKWDDNVDAILGTSDNMLIVQSIKSVAFSHVGSNLVKFSHSFNSEIAGIIFHLSNSGVIDVFSLGELKIIFDSKAFEKFPSSHEGERRASNSMQSELLGGVLRSLLCNVNKKTVDQKPLLMFLVEFALDQIEECSIDYAMDFFEGIFYATNNVPAIVSNYLYQRVLNLFKDCIDNSGGIRGEDEKDVGFSPTAKILLLVYALMEADIYSCVKYGNETCVFGEAVVRIITAPGVDLTNLVSFDINRNVLSGILNRSLYVKMVSSEIGDVEACLESILSACACSVLAPEEPNAAAVAAASTSLTSDEAATKKLQNASLVIASLLSLVASEGQSWRVGNVILELFSITIRGVSSLDKEFAGTCQQSCLRAAAFIPVRKNVYSDDVDAQRPENRDVVNGLIHLLSSFSLNIASFWTRFVAAQIGDILVTTHWDFLSKVEKVQLKEILIVQANTNKDPDISLMGQTSLSKILIRKSFSQLKDLADAYVRNSNKILLIERRARKDHLTSGAAAVAPYLIRKPEPTHISTVTMMSSLILTFPCDCPSFLPPVVVSLLRHSHWPPLREIVSRTLRDFKRTHHDRWEEDIKLLFNKDELDAITGAGSSNYFT